MIKIYLKGDEGLRKEVMNSNSCYKRNGIVTIDYMIQGEVANFAQLID